MQWNHFIYFALPAVACWTIASILSWKSRHFRIPVILTLTGLIFFALFIAGMWLSLERPPLRTMGETRLWYSFFLPAAGLILFIRWKYPWILSTSTLLASLFICINLFRPEIHNKALMPALQSPWFAPHVIVYMIAYALFGVAAIHALYLLIRSSDQSEKQTNSMVICDNLVYVGSAFLTIGMLLGAIWAKAAWGHYWSWDPKETWAAATWMGYIIYIHFRLHRPAERKIAYYLLIFSFLLLQVCWFGVNYLPSARGISVHTYS